MQFTASELADLTILRDRRRRGIDADAWLPTAYRHPLDEAAGYLPGLDYEGTHYRLVRADWDGRLVLWFHEGDCE